MRAEISKSPGSTPPGRITTTRSPGAKLCAPQTMPCGSPVPLASPTSTGHQLIVLPFFCGSGSIVSTLPTTSGPVIWSPGFSIASSLRPSAVSRAARSSVVTSAGRSTYSRIQETGAFMLQSSVPKAVVKRTSPSKSSRRSSMPWRNISVRSMPMPKAKPV